MLYTETNDATTTFIHHDEDVVVVIAHSYNYVEYYYRGGPWSGSTRHDGCRPDVSPTKAQIYKFLNSSSLKPCDQFYVVNAFDAPSQHHDEYGHKFRILSS